MKQHIYSKSFIFYVLAVLFALSTYSGIYRLDSIYYTGIVFLFLFFYFLIDFKKIILSSWLIWCFVLICLMSIIINNPPDYFRVWERLALLLNTLMAFSPILSSKRLDTSRVLLYERIIIIMMVFSVMSFIGYYSGINYFVYKGELLDYTNAGHFSGYANHSMTLAPISAMSGIFAFSKFCSSNKHRIKRIGWLIVALVCFGTVLLSASRGALIGSLLAIIVIIYTSFSGRIVVFLKYIIGGFVIAVVSFPLWEGLTQNVIEKNEYNISQGGVIYSREMKMEARKYEIKHYFWTGVGFSTVDESVDTVDKMTGTIEPNSSWLGVFSMTGVVGFLFFSLIFLNAFIIAHKKIPDAFASAMLCGMLAFFFVHLMIEGYVLAGGSFLCGMYWLTIGVVYALSNNNK